MARKTKIILSHATGSPAKTMKVPNDEPLSKLLRPLVRKLGVPAAFRHQWHSLAGDRFPLYTLYSRELMRVLLPDETLAGAGIPAGDTLRLLPSVLYYDSLEEIATLKSGTPFKNELMTIAVELGSTVTTALIHREMPLKELPQRIACELMSSPNRRAEVGTQVKQLYASAGLQIGEGFELAPPERVSCLRFINKTTVTPLDICSGDRVDAKIAPGDAIRITTGEEELEIVADQDDQALLDQIEIFPV